jgi:hypothetical protein
MALSVCVDLLTEHINSLTKNQRYFGDYQYIIKLQEIKKYLNNANDGIK